MAVRQHPHAYLEGLRKYGIRPSLERIRRALDAVGRPDRLYSIVLITGTNGKGTCAKALAEILIAHGVRTGLYLSPHVFSYRERYEINGRRETSRAFHHAVTGQRRILEGLRVRLTEFEFLTLLAYRRFAEARVSWAVVEVGMGGRWDATNAADPEVSILTSVGIDHVEFLGRTPEKIATDKSHVARGNRPLFVGPVSPGVRRAVESVAARTGAVPRFVAGGIGPEWRLPYPAPIYGANAALAIEAARHILRSRFRPACAQAGLGRARLPGRCQAKRWRGRRIILDVAHNEAAFEALFRHLRNRFARERFCVLLGMQRKKRGESAILPYLRAEDHVALIRLHRVHSKPLSAWRPFKRAARAKGIVTTGPESTASAIRRVIGMDARRTRVIVTGSFHTVREALEVCS